MRLYIRSSDFATEVPEITLLEGHIPAISNVTPACDDADENYPSMEPAVWFKVLVIDSVSIDCTKRAICWNSTVNNYEGNEAPGDGAAALRRNRLSESMFVGGEYFGYHNDIDELFDKTQQLLDSYVRSEVGRSDFNAAIFSLLHVYVLPNIKLNVDDRVEINKAVDKQEIKISEANDEMLSKCAKIAEIEKAMKKQRARFVTELNKASLMDLYYPPELVVLLHSHLERDIKEEWDLLDSRNDLVQSLKTTESDSSNAENGSQRESELELSLKRKERDCIQKNYEMTMNARELLNELANGGTAGQNPSKKWTKKYKKKVSKKKKQPMNPLHAIYIELNNSCKKVEKVMQEIMQKKVRLISVKEALKCALEELKENDETFGVEFDTTGSVRPTDVLHQSNIPTHWQTLAEQMRTQLTKGGAITMEHEEFKRRIIMQCQGLLDEQENLLNSVDINTQEKVEVNAINPTFYVEAETPDRTLRNRGVGCFPVRQCVPRSSIYRESKDIGTLAAAESANQSSDFLFIYDKDNDYVKTGITKLTKSIADHFEVMVTKFLEALELSSSQTNRSKIWIHDENTFYEG